MIATRTMFELETQVTSSMNVSTRPASDSCRGTGKIGICYVIDAIHTEQAGTEGHLLRTIRSLDRERFAPRLVVLQRSKWTDEFSDPEIPMEVLGFQSFFRPQDWQCFFRLARLLRSAEVKIVELYYTDAHFMGAVAARWAQVPVVISWRRHSGDEYNRKTRWMVRVGNRFVHQLIANSAVVARTLAPLERVPVERFEVHYNGIELAQWDAARGAPVDPRFDAHVGERPVVTIMANPRPVKNLPGFLEAARLIARERPDVRFVVLGSGADDRPLQQLARELGLQDAVLWMGTVPNPAPYLWRSHVGCLTSQAEGMSNAWLEYMAAELPVVCTRVGGAAEAVIDGKTGYLVPADDMNRLAQRVLELLAQPAVHRQFGQAGRKRVEESFDADRQRIRYVALLERLLTRTSK